MRVLCLLVLLSTLHTSQVHGFTVNNAIKLADKLRVMLRHPRKEYLPKVRKTLHMYAGVLSYLSLKLDQEPDESQVEDFYLFGPPRFMTMPIKDKRKLELKKTFSWSDRDLELFLEELNDAKKVWREFSRTVKSKKPELSDPVPNKSLFIN